MKRGEKVHDKESPSSAPFGGTFPLVGGRLGRAAQCAAPTGEAERFWIGGSRTRPYETQRTVLDSP